MMPAMSRHRLDHSVDRSDDAKEVSATARLQQIEVITGVERRRKWSAQEKVAIVGESLAEPRSPMHSAPPPQVPVEHSADLPDAQSRDQSVEA
jgi:hypothetical protein